MPTPDEYLDDLVGEVVETVLAHQGTGVGGPHAAIREKIREALAEIWEHGHEAAEEEERELRSSPFHVSSCDCGARKPNPFAKEGDL